MAKLAPPLPDVLTLADAALMWERSLRAADKSPRTLSAYRYALDKLIEHVGDRPVHGVDRSDHESLMSALQERGLGAATRVAIQRPLRTFWKWALAHPDVPVSRDPMAGMELPRLPEKVVEFVSDDQLRKILATCRAKSRHAFRAHRDEAIIRVLAGSGARLSEVASLRLEDVDLFGQALRVVGKGRRERWVPLDDGAVVALKRYLDRERPRSPHASSTDRLWLSSAGPMTPSGIAQMFAERGKAAGIARRVHPHELRHRFVATTLGAGLSEGDVMALTGHRTRSMLDRYGAFTRSARAQEAYRKAAASGAIARL
jgi:site-specific recombinase XerD